MAQKKQKRKQVAKRGKGTFIRPAGHTSEDYFWKEVAKKEKIDKQWKQFEKKFSKADLEKLKKGFKPVKKSAARRIVGKGLSRLIPGAGAVMIASEVYKGISKATCSKRGGEWVSGKCKVKGAMAKPEAGSQIRTGKKKYPSKSPKRSS